MRFPSTWLIAAILFVGLIGTHVYRPTATYADLILEVVRDGNPLTSPFLVKPNSTLTLEYFLTQTGTTTTTLTTQGLSTAVFTITVPVGIDHSPPSSFVPNSGLALDPIVDFLDPVTQRQLRVDLISFFKDSAELVSIPVFPDVGSNSIFLGRSNFAVSQGFTGPAEFSVSGGSGNELSGDLAFGFGPSPISATSNATPFNAVVAVPETSSLVMACLAALGIGLFRRRAWRSARSVAA